VKTAANPSTSRLARLSPLVVAVSSALAASLPAGAQQAAPSGNLGLDEIIVTAQKRSENLQTVPISIQAIDAKKLTDLQVASFQDYVRYLPSLTAQFSGPGQSQLYMRGITNGGDGVRSGPSPMVGVYLDELPVTTISNNLDIHVYDMARVEALSGPQGTLFGASSLAGTLRMITNKPEIGRYSGSVDVTGLYQTSSNDSGGKLEGYVNLPVNDQMAIRLVGWAEHDPGYINVVRGSHQYFPTSGIARDNSALVQRASNTTDTAGGRAALRFKLTDSWTITPTLMVQNQTAYGQYAYTPFAVTAQPTYADGSQGAPMTLGGTGDLNIARYFPEIHEDHWVAATLVVEGKIGDFDLTYSGGYIKRNVHDQIDYSDYSLFYDVHYAGTPGYYGSNFVDSKGNLLNPAQYEYGRNHLNKQTNEIRLATPTTWQLHGVVGFFMQRQSDELRYGYQVAGIAPSVHVDGQPDSLWYELAFRTDRDTAAFTDWTYEVTPKLAITGGIRYFHYDNTVNGYFGFGLNYPTPAYGGPYAGENICTTPINATSPDLPCQNLDYRATKSSETHRVNVTYKFDDDKMVYGTWSTGFRPGGINRIPSTAQRPVGPYEPDYLTNYEIGTKTSWFDNRLRVNGALFYEQWKDAQFGYSGPQGVQIFVNAGKAKSQGVEGEVHWRATQGLTLTTSFTITDATLGTDVCKRNDLPCSASNDPSGADPLLAPKGTRLPVSSKFKGNAIARYEWTADNVRWHWQLAGVYQTDSYSSLRTNERQIIGQLPAFGTLDGALGGDWGSWNAEFYVQNVFDRRGDINRYTTCVPSICRLVDVVPTRPRLLGLDIGYKF
jgi:iron complex outermembrane recepter protein